MDVRTAKERSSSLSRAVPKVSILNNEPSPVPTDKWYNKMLESVRNHPLHFPKWRIENGKLYKYVSDQYANLRDGNELWKEVVPKETRKSIISKYHDSTSSCHAGIYRTSQRIKTLYFWPKM